MPLVVYCLYISPIFQFGLILVKRTRSWGVLWHQMHIKLPITALSAASVVWQMRGAGEGVYTLKMKMRSTMGTTLKSQTPTNPLGWVHCGAVCTNHSGQCTVNTDRSTVPEQCLLFWSGGRLAGGRRLSNFTFTREKDGSGCSVFMRFLCVCVPFFFFCLMRGKFMARIFYYSNTVIKSSKIIFTHLSFETGLRLQKVRLMHETFTRQCDIVNRWNRQLTHFPQWTLVINYVGVLAMMHEEK